MPAPLKHTHKLKLHRYKSGTAVFFCALDCSFKISPGLALGKSSICWRCGDEFVISDYSVRLIKPHCEKCHKPRRQKAGDADIVQYAEDPGHVEAGINQAVMSLADRLKAATKTDEEEEVEI